MPLPVCPISTRTSVLAPPISTPASPSTKFKFNSVAIFLSGSASLYRKIKR